MKISITIFLLFITAITRVHGQLDLMYADFKKADSIAALYPKHSLKDLKLLVEKLTAPLSTEEEKFRAIYKWICNNIEYDYSLYTLNNYKREKLKNKEDLKAWKKYFTSYVFKNLINKHKTICTGYAYLVKELSSYAGLSCKIIDGYGRTAQSNIRGTGNINHSWNAIRLNQKWYLCDATWSSGAYDVETSIYTKQFNASYFLADPVLFVRNHYPLDSTWTLLDNKPTLHEFLNRPLIYSGAFRYKIVKLFPETFDVTAVKGKTISFGFNINQGVLISKAEFYCKELNIRNVVNPNRYNDIDHSAGENYHVDHIFTTRGKYIVHILLNDNYAFTYTVTVR